MARNSIYCGKRATVEQMTEARLLCGKDPALVAKLDNLLNKRPNDRIMQKFIEYVHDPNRNEGGFAVEQGVRINSTLREKLLALTDENLATLVLVATHAIGDLEAARMIADEISMDVDKLAIFGEKTVLPLSTEAENLLGWYDTANR